MADQSNLPSEVQADDAATSVEMHTTEPDLKKIITLVDRLVSVAEAQMRTSAIQERIQMAMSTTSSSIAHGECPGGHFLSEIKNRRSTSALAKLQRSHYTVLRGVFNDVVIKAAITPSSTQFANYMVHRYKGRNQLRIASLIKKLSIAHQVELYSWLESQGDSTPEDEDEEEEE